MSDSLYSFRRKLFELLEPARAGRFGSDVVDRFLIVLIVANVLAVVAESFAGLRTSYAVWFDRFELFSVIVFVTEYLLRLWTADFKYPGRSWGGALWRQIRSPMAIIDLAAILPFFIPLVIRLDLRTLRLLRLTRLLRILKINRYTEALALIGRVLKRKSQELLVTVFVTMLLLLLAASVMYYLETDDQPESFPNIISSFWWAVATLTTVGYGDVFPVTPPGRLLAGIIALLGIGIVALPAGILGSGFLEEVQQHGSIGARHARNRIAQRKRYRKTRGRKTRLRTPEAGRTRKHAHRVRTRNQGT